MTLSLYKSVLRSAALVALLVVTLLGSLPVSSAHAELLSKPNFLGGDFVWAKRFGEMVGDVISRVITDPDGNIYILGTFSTPETLFHLTSVAKLNGRGEIIWSKGLDNIGYYARAYPNAVALDSIGNVYMSGSFHLMVDFDPGVAQLYLTSVGTEDAFVTKLDQNGDFVWVKTIGGIGLDYYQEQVISKGKVIDPAETSTQ